MSPLLRRFLLCDTFQVYWLARLSLLILAAWRHQPLQKDWTSPDSTSSSTWPSSESRYIAQRCHEPYCQHSNIQHQSTWRFGTALTEGHGSLG